MHHNFLKTHFTWEVLIKIIGQEVISGYNGDN